VFYVKLYVHSLVDKLKWFYKNAWCYNKIYQFSNFRGNIYWHLHVPFSHFSVSWLSELQFGVIYLETWVANNPTLHYRHLNFILVSLLLAVHTQHWILLHCLSQSLLCLVSRLFSWLVDGAWFPCLVFKMLSGEGSASVRGVSVCRNPLGPLVNLLASDTVNGQLILTVHCAKFVPVTHSVWLLSKNDFNLLIKVRQSPSLQTRPDSVGQASAVPGLSHVIALHGGGLSVELQRLNMDLHQNNVTLRHIPANPAAVEKQWVLHILGVYL